MRLTDLILSVLALAFGGTALSAMQIPSSAVASLSMVLSGVLLLSNPALSGVASPPHGTALLPPGFDLANPSDSDAGASITSADTIDVASVNATQECHGLRYSCGSYQTRRNCWSMANRSGWCYYLPDGDVPVQAKVNPGCGCWFHHSRSCEGVPVKVVRADSYYDPAALSWTCKSET